MEPDNENSKSRIQIQNDPKRLRNSEKENSTEQPSQQFSLMPKDRRNADSPYQDLMNNLNAINSYYSKRS